MLRTAHEAIVQRQSGDDNYLGDLGEYCERFNNVWQSRPSNIATVQFNFTHTRDQVFGYLQDAFEIHYWSLMADLFLEERSNSPKRNQSTEVVLRVLSSLRHELRRQLAKLAKLEDQGVPEPIKHGIDARMRLLDGILETAQMKDTGTERQHSHQTAASHVDPSPVSNATTTLPASQSNEDKTELVSPYISSLQWQTFDRITGKRQPDDSFLPLHRSRHRSRLDRLLQVHQH